MDSIHSIGNDEMKEKKVTRGRVQPSLKFSMLLKTGFSPIFGMNLKRECGAIIWLTTDYGTMQ